MLYRPHRRFLDEAMKEVKEFNTEKELRALFDSCDNKNGKLEFTDQGMDGRIGWHSYLVSVDGMAVGHTDGLPIED